MKLAALLLACTGCATVNWTCKEPVVLTLRDTETVVRCPSNGNTVTITHPKAVAP